MMFRTNEGVGYQQVLVRSDESCDLGYRGYLVFNCMHSYSRFKAR
jgi:hypothetical protein